MTNYWPFNRPAWRKQATVEGSNHMATLRSNGGETFHIECTSSDVATCLTTVVVFPPDTLDTLLKGTAIDTSWAAMERVEMAAGFAHMESQRVCVSDSSR